MKNSTKKSILLFYQSYKENAPYDFDSNQIKHLFEKFKIKKYDKNIPKKLKNNYLENSQEYRKMDLKHNLTSDSNESLLNIRWMELD